MKCQVVLRIGDLWEMGSDEIIFEDQGNDEVEASDAPRGERTIRTDSGDPEIESLHNKWKRGRLILQPDFQRQFVWDGAKSSRLIESALLSVPLPIVYLAEESDNKESVIDGQQRLTSFFSFIDGKYPNGSIFRLSSMKVFPELNKKLFSELSEELQDRIRYYKIRAVTIRRDSDSELKFEIFERLNTGSVPLNEMELRNCVYRGKYINLLKELAGDPNFLRLVGLKEPDKRMKDVELALRFASFYHSTYLKYKSPMKRFFNQDMDRYKNISDADSVDLHASFKNSINIITSLFGESAFKRFYIGNDTNHNGTWESQQFNSSLFDVLMGVFHDKNKNQVYATLDSLREGIIDLMTTNHDFIDAITLGTSEVSKVQKRFDLVRLLVDEILKESPSQVRCFSRRLKQDLFDSDPTCLICGQKITLVDDAAVDHITQYWRGGKTIPLNARLTHRFCNLSRPRKD